MPVPIETVTGLSMEQIDTLITRTTPIVAGVLELLPTPLRAFVLAMVINQSSAPMAFYDAIGDVLAARPDDDGDDDDD